MKIAFEPEVEAHNNTAHLHGEHKWAGNEWDNPDMNAQPSISVMARIAAFLIFAVIGHALHAESIIVPPPDEMLSSADVVAVATLSKKDGVWTLVLKEVLKGNFRPGDKAALSSPYSESAFSFDYLARLVGEGDFLFVGHRHSSNSTLQPTFVLGSFWPQGTTKELLPERTLTDAIARAKKSLGLTAQTPSGSRNKTASQSKQ